MSKMVNCSKSQFHGFHAVGEDCPWCDPTETKPEADKAKDDKDIAYWPSGRVRWDGPAIQNPSYEWFVMGKPHNSGHPAKYIKD